MWIVDLFSFVENRDYLLIASEVNCFPAGQHSSPFTLESSGKKGSDGYRARDSNVPLMIME